MADKVTKAEIELAKRYKEELLGAGKAAQALGMDVKGFGTTNKKEMKAAVKDLDDVKNSLEDMESQVVKLQSTVKKVSKASPIKKEEAIALNAELKSIETEILRIHKMKPLFGGALKQQQGSLKKLEKQLGTANGKVNKLESSSKDWSDVLADTGPNFIKKWAGFKKGVKESNAPIVKSKKAFDEIGDRLSDMPGKFSKIGGAAAKGMGAALGSITKLMTGWPALIFGAVKAFAEVVNMADKFQKDANKAFAVMRGPDIMSGGVREQFKEFNNQIYQAGENIRVGFDVTQIRELLDAVHIAGANITNLNKGLLTYRDSIYVAAKASKTLGIELPMVGQLMGKMIVDLRMDLDQMDDAFVQLAFDAQKSGLSTDRFWTTVQNASSSLALYGVVVKQASQTMSGFTESMVGGADDAAEATENMFDAFKSGGLKAQGAIISFAKKGEVNINKIFEEAAEEAAGQANTIESKIKVLQDKGVADKAAGNAGTENLDEIRKLRKQLFAAQSKTDRFSKMEGKSSVVQASEMGALAKEAPKIIIGAIEGQVGKLNTLVGEKLLNAIKAAEVMGVHEKTVRMLVETAKVTSANMKDLAARTPTYFSKLNTKTDQQKAHIANAVIAAADATGNDRAKATQKLSKILQEDLGIGEVLADEYAQAFNSDSANAEKIANLIKNGGEGTIAGIQDILKTDKQVSAVTEGVLTDQKKAEEDIKKATENTFRKIVDQTLSYEEMIKMAKDEGAWRMATLGIFTGIGRGVSVIKQWLFNQKPMETEEQKYAKAALAAQGIIISSGKKGEFKLDEIATHMKKVEENIAKSKEKVLAGGKAVLSMTGAAGKIGRKGKEVNTAESIVDLEDTFATGMSNAVATIKELAPQIGKLTDIQKDELQEAKDTAENLKNLREGAKISAGILKEIKVLEGQTPKKNSKDALKRDARVKELKAQLVERNKMMKPLLATQITKAEETLGVNKYQLGEQVKMRENLIALNGEARVASEIRKQIWLSTDEGKKRAAELLMEQMKAGGDPYATSSGLGFKPEEIKKVLEEGKGVGATFEGAVIDDKKIASLVAKVTEGYDAAVFKEAKEKTAPQRTVEKGRVEKVATSKGPVQDFYDVVKGGFVNVQSGDILVDKESLAQGTGGAPGAAIPSIVEAAGGAAGAAGAGGVAAGANAGQTINIKVDATEKDLAGRIANQIKKELYNRQIATSSYSLG